MIKRPEGKTNHYEIAGGSSYRAQKYSKYEKRIEGSSIFVRVDIRFELPGVRVNCYAFILVLIFEASQLKEPNSPT